MRKLLAYFYILSRRHRVAIRVVLSLLVLLPLFQNCSAIKAKSVLNQSSSSTDPGQDPNPTPVPQPTPGEPAVAYKFSCTNAQKRGLSESQTRRLSRDELQNTLRDLLGSTVYTGLAAELQALPGDAIKEKVTEFKQMHSEAHVQAMLGIGLKAADLIVDNQTQLKAVVSACVASSGAISLTQTCVQNFIRDFGIKVFRRPLTNEEIQSYLALYGQGTTTTDGVKLVIMSFLQSPNFLFIVESGTTQANNGRVRLTDYEVASRLSYRLLGTMPDDELFAAAGRGELQVLSNVKQHAERLAQGDRMKARVELFFNYWARLNDFPAFTFSNAFLDGVNITGLREEVLQETRDFINYVVWERRGNVKELLNSQAGFVKTDRMAQLYGSSKMSGSAPVTLGADRSGLLLRPGFLAGGTDISAPIGRSVLIRRRVLCDPLPSPSTDIINSRLEELGHLDRAVMSNRQIVNEMTKPALCMSCHNLINPIGYAFEAYDGLGRKRTVEKVYNQSGQLIAQHPIDTKVDGLMLDDSTPITVNTAAEIVSRMADGVKAPACFATHIYRFTRLREEVSDDNCALSDMEHAVKDSGGSILDGFIRNVANEDIFWKKEI